MRRSVSDSMRKLCVCRCIESGLVRMSDAGEILQHVLDCKLHCDSRPRVASADQVFKVLILANEFILHRVPHHLVEQCNWSEIKNTTTAMRRRRNGSYFTCSRLSSSHRCLSTFLYRFSNPFFTSLPGYSLMTLRNSCLLKAS